MMNKIKDEPLLHFLLVGAAIFAAYTFVAERSVNEPGKIVITGGQVAALEVGFTRSRNRPPTREELDGLIRDRVQEEVYFREAMALGLDKDDTIVRRRLRQKMEFITDDVATLTEPTDEELNGYMKEHADVFRVERGFTFRHVFLSPERRGENVNRDAAELLAELRLGGERDDVSELGDAFLLEHTFRSMPASEIVKLFGGGFAAKLGELSPSEWHGPIESGYGMHLVWVSERTEGRLPSLEEVRDAVLTEWNSSRKKEANEKYYEDLLKRYIVTIEPANAATGEERRTGATE